MSTERSKAIEANVERWTTQLRTAVQISYAALRKIPEGEIPKPVELSAILGEAVHKIRELVRPEPKTVAFLEEEAWYRMKRETKPGEKPDPAAGTGAFFTKPEILDAILANPPMGDLPPGADGVEPHAEPIDPKAPKMVRGEAVCPHRYDRVDIYRLGPMDFVRQDNTDGRVTYTSLADTSGAHPQPRLYRMTIIPRDGGGRVVCIFGTFGELVGKFVASMGTRNDIERAARWLCASIVARAYHKRASQARWRANKRARLAEQDANGEVVEA